MEEFKELENLWKTSKIETAPEKTDFKKIKNNRNKMESAYLRGAAMLFITGIIILLVMYFLEEKLQTITVITAMAMITVTCFLQAILMLFTAKKISDIDESQMPGVHLKQWQNFRIFQLNQRRWNMPLYFLVLGLSLGVYYLEILRNVELWKIILVYVITYSWMLFAYFYLGKKSMKKEDIRIEGIITELKNLENQFH